jgi:hypothetical protein
VVYFSNATLTTHNGKAVRFYDDLNPGQGRDVQHAPRGPLDHAAAEQDSPEDFKIYAGFHGMKPGWLFLMGHPPPATMSTSGGRCSTSSTINQMKRRLAVPRRFRGALS